MQRSWNRKNRCCYQSWSCCFQHFVRGDNHEAREPKGHARGKDHAHELKFIYGRGRMLVHGNGNPQGNMAEILIGVW
jgi:hypothetical protein